MLAVHSGAEFMVDGRFHVGEQEMTQNVTDLNIIVGMVSSHLLLLDPSDRHI